MPNRLSESDSFKNSAVANSSTHSPSHTQTASVAVLMNERSSDCENCDPLRGNNIDDAVRFSSKAITARHDVKQQKEKLEPQGFKTSTKHFLRKKLCM